jgi:1-deoxy-D-xylulose-5-phosphate reductoisomerase
MKRKRVVILGATGSIGESALKVAHDIPERMEVVGLAANNNAEKLAKAANKARPEAVCLGNQTKIDALRAALDYERLPDKCGHGAGGDRGNRRPASRAGCD